MDKLLNNEIVDSTKKAIKDKIDSSLYGTFIIYWLIFHWRFVYVTFFIGEDIIWNSNNLLKSDYLLQEFFKWKTFEFWFWWAVPVIFTILTVWVFPRLFIIKAYKREQEDEYTKRIFKIQKETELEREKTRFVQQSERTSEAVVKRIEQEKRIEKIDPTINWEIEFRKLMDSNNRQALEILIECVYKYNGFISVENDFRQEIFRIPQRMLAFLHVNDFIILDKVKNRLEITEKGKFFVKKFNEIN